MIDFFKLSKGEVIDLLQNKDSTLVQKSHFIYDALEKGNFYVMYQPKVSILRESLGTVIGLEALIRLNHNGEEIGPWAFIDFCEKEKLIIPIGTYVTQQVAETMNQWKLDGMTLVPCSINVTREQIYPGYRSLHYDQPYSFAQQTKDIISKFDLETHLFDFEIIERNTSNILEETKREIIMTLMEIQNNGTTLSKKIIEEILEKINPRKLEFDDIKPELLELKKIGFKLSVDDYGSGEHNVDTLLTGVFDTLKLDKKTIDLIPQVLMDVERGTPIEFKPFFDFLHFGSNYGLDLIAEGVESLEQLNYLRFLEYYGKMYTGVQGFYFSKPVLKEEIPDLLKPNYFEKYFIQDMNLIKNK
jgi:EAL domain-containing protein (putative c-di-GMP-specific phosphodiesterase class I)